MAATAVMEGGQTMAGGGAVAARLTGGDWELGGGVMGAFSLSRGRGSQQVTKQ